MMLGRHVQYNTENTWRFIICRIHVPSGSETWTHKGRVATGAAGAAAAADAHLSPHLQRKRQPCSCAAESYLQCYLGTPPICAVVRRLIPVQRDEWTEEVNEALWIDEQVSVRVHKVSSCSVLSPSGLPKITFGQLHKGPPPPGARFHQAPVQVAVHSARSAGLHCWLVQLQLVTEVCHFKMPVTSCYTFIGAGAGSGTLPLAGAAGAAGPRQGRQGTVSPPDC